MEEVRFGRWTGSWNLKNEGVLGEASLELATPTTESKRATKRRRVQRQPSVEAMVDADADFLDQPAVEETSQTPEVEPEVDVPVDEPPRTTELIRPSGRHLRYPPPTPDP